MKSCQIKSPKAIQGNKTEGEQDGPGKLKTKGDADDASYHLKHIGKVVVADGFLSQYFSSHADLPSEKNGEKGGQSNHAKAAYLNQGQNNKLTEEGPLGKGISNNQPGDTGGGGGSE